jgi:hypothetical protein
MSAFVFAPLTVLDLPRIEVWLRRAHVREAFGDPTEWLTEISANLSSNWVRHFRADLCGSPAGFVQFYDTARAPHGPWSQSRPPRSVSISSWVRPSC